MSTSNMYLSLIGSTWIRSRVHANYFGSDPVCTLEKFWIRSKKEWTRTDPLSCAQGLCNGSALVCTGLRYSKWNFHMMRNGMRQRMRESITSSATTTIGIKQGERISMWISEKKCPLHGSHASLKSLKLLKKGKYP